MQLSVELTDDRRGYPPGEPITGRVSWDGAADAERMELRLYYFTEGRGTRDVGMSKVVRFDAPASSGAHEFDFPAPVGPYSCSGTLLTLHWALELVALPSQDHSEPLRLEIGPGGESVVLRNVAPFDADD